MAIFDNIASLLALLVSAIAIIGFVVARRKSAIEEGKHLETVQQIKRDLDHAYDKIHDLEKAFNERDVALAGIKADVKNVLDAVRRIEAKLDGHIVGGA